MAEEAEAAQAESALLMRMLEALLFAAKEPLSPKALGHRLPPAYAGQNRQIKAALAALEDIYSRRGVHLVRRGESYAFRTAADLQYLFTQEEKQVKKLSRAAREVLAVIAYHQPLSRAELEDIRGVETARGTLDILLETGWVKLAGRRDAPGRPVLYGTSTAFLDYFGLADIADLPGLKELEGAGLLSFTAPLEGESSNEAE